MRSIEYTWIGDISSKFGSVIEDIGQEKSSALTTWCEVDDGDANFDASTFIGCDPDENVPLFFLLSSWRAFLLVMSKDSPFSLYLPRAAAAASFISCLAPYTATWRQEHPSSLLLLYRASCTEPSSHSNRLAHAPQFTLLPGEEGDPNGGCSQGAKPLHLNLLHRA